MAAERSESGPADIPAALFEITRALASSLDQGDVLRILARQTAHLVGAERCAVNLWREGRLVPVALQLREADGDLERWARLHASGPYRLDEIPAQAEASRTLAPVGIADALDSPLVPRSWAEQLGTRALLLVPLVHGKRVTGIVFLDRTDGPHAWQPAQLDLAMAIATQAAIALEHARVSGENERRRGKAEQISQLARRISGSLEPPEIARDVVTSLCGFLGARTAHLFRLDPDSGALIALAVSGDVPPGLAAGLVVPPGIGLSGLAIQQARVLISPDVLTDPRVSLTPELEKTLEQAAHRSEVAIPLASRGRIVGILAIGDRKGKVPREEDIQLAQALADQVALALDNAQLLAETRQRLAETETLLSIARLLALDLPIQEAMRRVGREVAHALQADMIGAYALSQDKTALVPLAGYRVPPHLRSRLLEAPFPVSAPVALREAWATGTPAWTPDVTSDPAWLGAPLLDGLPAHAALFAPTRVRGESVGGLFVIWWRAGRIVSDTERRLISAIAGQVGFALEHKQGQELRARLEGELRHAQKMEAVGRLAGGVAHDFNNLLTVIVGRTELLLQRVSAADPLRRHLGLIRDTGRRATDLTRQLLAFSRKQLLQPRLLNLTTVVAGMSEMLERLIGEHIELVIHADFGLRPVKADPAQIEQVILNLVVNARDAMPDGGRLTIETATVHLDADFTARHVEARSGPHARLSVTDTGAGMSPETMAHVFEPFFTTKETGQGTGLGLAIVYGIVKQSGGYVDVQSTPGRGSTFTVYLPLAEGVTEPSATAAAGPARGGSGTILLVEDEASVRELATEILEDEGYRLIASRHPGEALLIGEKYAGPIDLLLTDVVMPQLNGRELAARLAAFHPEMKILYMSGYTDDAIVHHGVLDGGTILLPKPFTPQALKDRVRDALEGPRAGP